MKYSIKYTLLPAARKDGTHTIRMRISWNGKRVTHYLSESVPVSGWDVESGLPKKAHKDAVKETGRLSSNIDDLFDRAHVDRRIPTEEEIRTALGDVPEVESDTHKACVALQEFVQEQSVTNNWSEGTRKRFGVLLSHLKAWNEDANVEDMSEETVKSFMNHLYSTGMVNSTVAKSLVQLRWWLRWCKRKGYTSNDSWDEYKPKIKESEKDVVYLTEEELGRVIALDLSGNPSLDNVRDMFLFCCFTGLRYSDMSRLMWSEIHDDHFCVVTKKTNDPLKIELNRMSKAIIDKYRQLRTDDRDGLVFPVMYNQKMNDKLKVLGEMAEVTDPVRRVYWIRSERHEEVLPKYKVLSTHCGRRTFVVTALRLEISPEVIVRWTGHNDTKAMRPYMAIVDKLKQESMSRFDKLDI